MTTADKIISLLDHQSEDDRFRIEFRRMFKECLGDYSTPEAIERSERQKREVEESLANTLPEGVWMAKVPLGPHRLWALLNCNHQVVTACFSHSFVPVRVLRKAEQQSVEILGNVWEYRVKYEELRSKVSGFPAVCSNPAKGCTPQSGIQPTPANLCAFTMARCVTEWPYANIDADDDVAVRRFFNRIAERSQAAKNISEYTRPIIRE